MKRFIALFLLALLLLPQSYALAAESGDTAREPSHVTITVVMPETPRDKPEPPALPELSPDEPDAAGEPTPTPVIPKVYPVDVTEITENGVRWIVKTYELAAGENPADIPREDFIRDGWAYALTDVTKKITAAADSREHSETVTINTETKDMEAILPLLAPTMEFTAEDGYYGVLALDVSGVTVETAGTKTSSYTSTVKREYPHLSSNDTSLVPKTITENGRTYTLAGVDWKSQTSETVDYDQIPASYTAAATYTAPASKTVVTGYVTTAVYSGTLSKLNQGATVYTAYFMGEEIIPERIPLELVSPSPSPEPTPGAGSEPDGTDNPGSSAAPGAAEEPSAEADSGETAGNPLAVIIPAALFILLLGAGGGYYIPRIIQNKKSKGEPDA